MSLIFHIAGWGALVLGVPCSMTFGIHAGAALLLVCVCQFMYLSVFMCVRALLLLCVCLYMC